MFGRARNNRQRTQTGQQATLAGMRPGDQATVQTIEDSTARAQAVRFGMGAGAVVHCIATLPGGPVVLRSGRQEIAVGRGLARTIRVQSHGVRRECA